MSGHLPGRRDEGTNPGRTGRRKVTGQEVRRRRFEGERRHERMNPDRKVRGTVERGVADEAGNSFSPDAARKQTARSSSLHIKLCSWNNPTEDTRGRDRDFGEGNRAEVQELPRSVVLAPASLVVLWKGSDRDFGEGNRVGIQELRRSAASSSVLRKGSAPGPGSRT